MTDRDHLHALIDELPESQTDAAARYLEFLQGDGGDVTDVLIGHGAQREQYIKAVEEGIACADRGEFIEHEEVVARIEKILSE
jgi:hypothetical protein